MLVISALGKLRQEDNDSLAYILSSDQPGPQREREGKKVLYWDISQVGWCTLIIVVLAIERKIRSSRSSSADM